MRKKQLQKQKVRRRRVLRVRKKLRGSALRPRLCVVKTNKHIHAQIIDDEAGKTIVGLTTYSKEFQNTENNCRNKESASKLGERLAELALEKNVKEVIFDRGRSKYHGVLASLASAAREKGLQF